MQEKHVLTEEQTAEMRSKWLKFGSKIDPEKYEMGLHFLGRPKAVLTTNQLFLLIVNITKSGGIVEEWTYELMGDKQ